MHAVRRSAAGFVGAYDSTPSIAALFAMRRAVSDYDGNLIRLRRGSDNAELDFGSVANGDLDTAAIATWLGGASGFITTLYGQRNGLNATQTTAANQPLYVASGQNGKPVARFDGANDYIRTASVSFGSNVSFLFTAKYATADKWGLFDSAPGQANVLRNRGGPSTPLSNYLEWWNRQPELEIGAPTNEFAIMSFIFSLNPSRRIDKYINGGSHAFAANASTTAAAWTTLTFGTINTTFNPFAGDIAEIVIANAVWSTAEREAAESSANSYWSIF